MSSRDKREIAKWILTITLIVGLYLLIGGFVLNSSNDQDVVDTISLVNIIVGAIILVISFLLIMIMGMGR